MTARRRGAALVALGLVGASCLGASCGSDRPDGITLDDPWARPTPPNAETGAIYFVARNGTDADDVLVEATSPWCDHIEVHTTEWRDDIMSMYLATDEQRVVPADTDVAYEPAGLHLMCVDLTRPIVEGEPVTVTVTFATAGPIEITAAAEQR